ncbi:MAG: peptidylprolyl isomerase [Gammaproteobacteria bacterium]|nr:peptidylprolyl isomerase [Gammaproteobacteria bacterium]MCW8923083.1 peptidylprolyl isomerase [Gammaproteobacteria bacterium]
MQIEKDKVATLHYTLKDNEGNILDRSSDGSFVYLHGAMNIIPGLENALAGKSSGESINVKIAPEEAYGVRNDEHIQEVPKGMFEEGVDIQVGMQFHAQGPNGETLMVTVTEVKDEVVVIDGNHPLAGMELNFDVRVIDVRDASTEELEHGHVHSPEGCGH